MLELSNFYHMTTLTMSWAEIMTSLVSFIYTFMLRRDRVATFGNIIKIATMFIKTTFKDSKNAKMR